MARIPAKSPFPHAMSPAKAEKAGPPGGAPDAATGAAAAKRTDVFETAGSARLFDGLGTKAGAILGAHAARGIEAAKAAAEGLAGIAGAPQGAPEAGSPLGVADLVDRGTTLDDLAAARGGGERPGGVPAHPDTGRAPDLPSNKGGHRFFNLDLTPSSDPRQWASGVAAGDGNAGAKEVWTSPDGNTRTVTTVRDDGTVTQDTTVQEEVPAQRHADGSVTLPGTRNVRRDVTTYNPDGSQHVVHYRWNDTNGTWQETTRELRLPPQEGVDRLLDPNAPVTGGVSMVAPGQNPDFSLPDPDRVDPGPEGGVEEPEASRLRPGEGLVTDPDGVRSERRLTAEMAARLKGTFRLPGPGGDPGPQEG